jgi:hypothetical protein
MSSLFNEADFPCLTGPAEMLKVNFPSWNES